MLLEDYAETQIEPCDCEQQPEEVCHSILRIQSLELRESEITAQRIQVRSGNDQGRLHEEESNEEFESKDSCESV